MSMSGRRSGRFQKEDMLEALGEIDGSVEAEVAELVPEDIVELAERALEEYDYERAHSLFRSAVLRSEGEAEFVCRLATFLVDDYAYFDEAVALLTCPSCEVSDEGQRLLAHSYFMAGKREDALAAYRLVNARQGDLLSWKRQGILFKELGRFAEALAAFGSALERDTADSEAGRLKSECQEALLQELAPALSRAEADIEAGRLDEARLVLDGLAHHGWLPPAYYRVRNRLDAVSSSLQATALLDTAATLEAGGDSEGALDAYRRVLQVDEGCQLAAERVSALEGKLVEKAARNWVEKGNRHFETGKLGKAIHHYFMAVTRYAGVEGVSPAARPLFEMVAEYNEQTGKMPSSAQLQALEALFMAVSELDKGNVERAELFANRAGNLSEQLSAGRDFQEQLARLKRHSSDARARAWMEQANALETEGRLAEAAKLYKRAGRAEGFGDRNEALDKARQLKEAVRTREEAASFERWVNELIEQGEFFQALRELRKNPQMAELLPVFEELEAAACRGVSTKYPVVLTPYEGSAEGLVDAAEYRSSKDSLAGFVPDKTRVLNSSPGGKEVFLISGNRLLLLDSRELRPRLTASLPPQADLTDKKGFALYGLAPGDKNALVFVNFDEDLVLYFLQKRASLDLVNSIPLGKMLQQSRRQITRWFCLNGREEQLMVCQSAPGASNSATTYALSLHDGKLVHSEEFGYALSHLQMVPGQDNLYVIHRHPEPVHMRRRGYYSLAYLDGRMRVMERHHIPQDELDGTLVESTRWVRFGPLSDRRYSLFRYYDAFSGQLVARPLAFVALHRQGAMLYGAADSSTLVRDEGDLDPLGELVISGGKEYLAVVGRKGEQQRLFFICLDDFKLVQTHPVPDGETIVALARGRSGEEVVTVALNDESGEVIVKARTFS